MYCGRFVGPSLTAHGWSPSSLRKEKQSKKITVTTRGTHTHIPQQRSLRCRSRSWSSFRSRFRRRFRTGFCSRFQNRFRRKFQKRLHNRFRSKTQRSGFPEKVQEHFPEVVPEQGALAGSGARSRADSSASSGSSSGAGCGEGSLQLSAVLTCCYVGVMFYARMLSC